MAVGSTTTCKVGGGAEGAVSSSGTEVTGGGSGPDTTGTLDLPLQPKKEVIAHTSAQAITFLGQP